jgi:hypothetical protein
MIYSLWQQVAKKMLENRGNFDFVVIRCWSFVAFAAKHSKSFISYSVNASIQS